MIPRLIRSSHADRSMLSAQTSGKCGFMRNLRLPILEAGGMLSNT